MPESLSQLLTPELISQLTALGSVILIDIVLAGDNAIVVALAAAGLPRRQQRRAIMIGIAVALLCRVAFALIATQLLAIIGLLLAGGLLLLWVAWKLWREIRSGAHLLADLDAGHGGTAAEDEGESIAPMTPQAKTFSAAVWQITIADVSMSLDNVLAVAGAAREHPYIMAGGLVLSVALMGVAAGYIAKVMQKHHWLAYVGLLVILWVALAMIYEGGVEVMDAVGGPEGIGLTSGG